ncbi:hypothetical protein PV326_001843 [Microctonus aethiopoides]|nr:hypothetical protein PV326_001843 [Microctonus aethiopoides]
MDSGNKEECRALLEHIDDKMINNPELFIRRPVYEQKDLDCIYDYSKPEKSLKQTLKSTYKEFRLNDFLKKTIPIIHWLPNYDWKKNILGDAVAGFTVAVMHIPQGTFAVICMMTGKVVLTYSNHEDSQSNSTSSIEFHSSINQYSPIEVATSVTLGVALIQLTMYVLRLGVISSLLSETLVSGFTTGAAVHVFTSQLKDLLGLKLIKRRGILKVIYTYFDVFNNIDKINVTATIISSITILTIIFNNEVLKPRVAKLCAFPIPIEMMAVVMGTWISVQLNLSEIYDVTSVGHIPVGLPIPSMPPISLLSSTILDCFIITMVSYSISMSMALIFAQKLNYEVDSNQELMAQGLGNLVGSFFSCMPFTASLSRSLVQTSVGGKTQLASLISCFLLLFVLLWIGPFLEPLPKCVLASIIVVALKGMFVQVKDLMKFCRLSFSDALLWLITFFTVVILDIEYGLLIGGILCFAKLIILSVIPHGCKLALVPDTELYLDIERYRKTMEIPGIQIFHYCGGLNFATKLHFRKRVFEATGIKPQEELNRRAKMYFTEGATDEIKNQLRVLILDFSALTHIDSTGFATLRGLINDYMKIDVAVYLAGCSGPVFETIRKCNTVENVSDIFVMLPTVSDAVRYAKHENLILPISIPSSQL